MGILPQVNRISNRQSDRCDVTSSFDEKFGIEGQVGMRVESKAAVRSPLVPSITLQLWHATMKKLSKHDKRTGPDYQRR
jgi:hypothetical protein